MTPPDGATHWDGPGLDAWKPWRPSDVAAKLRGLAAPWCVVGGWALDLWHGRQTREHEDLEIAIARSDFPTVRHRLAAFKFHAVGDGEVRSLDPGQVTPPEKHQNWVLDEAANAWRLDVMLEPGDDQTWVFRRDETVTRQRSRMVATSGAGVPYLRPEGVLLYKAKAARPKDQADFALALPAMDAEARDWLRQALEHVHPGHAWLEALYR
jgi:hypothetical protein